MFVSALLVYFFLLACSLDAAHAVEHNGSIETAAVREFFYVGGEYTNITIGNETKQYRINQIYVERLTPSVVTHEHPIIFIAGSGQTGTNFLNTPDGRPGWATFFLQAGYVVLLTDQAQRGRSPWSAGMGTIISFSTGDIESLFTATSALGDWPQAKLHNQWPGPGIVGDPVFDAFYSSQVQLQANNTLSEIINAAAYETLLKTVGPAYLITHSQAGAYGWRVGDACPDLVKGIVGIEPPGPPFEGVPPFGGRERVWGITTLEVTYEPSAGPNATNLRTTIQLGYDEEHLPCELQIEPAKQLVNLGRVPVMIVTGEASFHQPYDYCTVEYLRQAGVKTEFLDLGTRGIHGNGHMLFMEKNNAEIAQQVLDWLVEVENMQLNIESTWWMRSL